MYLGLESAAADRGISIRAGQSGRSATGAKRMQILGSVACEHNGRKMILHAEAGASVMPRGVRSDDVDHPPRGTR
jgi:hypothetical protein